MMAPRNRSNNLIRKKRSNDRHCRHHRYPSLAHVSGATVGDKSAGKFRANVA